jgi:O-antigen ligase
MLYRLIGIGGALVALVMLARTASRGGMIAFVVSMAVYTLALRPGRFFAMLLVSAMAGAGLWQFGPPMFRERAESLFHLENDYNSSSEGGRIAIWKRGLGLVRDYPVFGVGVGNFGNADGARRVAKGQLGRWFTAHNTYLQAAAEMGIPGGIVLLCLLGRAARDSWPLYRRRSRARSPNIGQRPEYLASLVAFCTSGFFLSHAVNPLLFAVVGLCGLAGLVARAAPAAAGVPALPGYAGYVPDAPAAAPRGLIGPRRRLMRGGLAAFQ